jgi:hypothetical protein
MVATITTVLPAKLESPAWVSWIKVINPATITAKPHWILTTRVRLGGEISTGAPSAGGEGDDDDGISQRSESDKLFEYSLFNFWRQKIVRRSTFLVDFGRNSDMHSGPSKAQSSTVRDLIACAGKSFNEKEPKSKLGLEMS